MTSGVVIPGSSTRDLLVKSPAITNVSILVPNTEQSIGLAGTIRRLTIKARGTATLRLAFQSTESATNYITIAPGAIFTEENFEAPAQLYFQADKIDTVEILTWVKV